MKSTVCHGVLKFILIVLLSIGMTGTVFAQSNITVELNGRALGTSVPPKRINGRILVPMRDIFEALGASIQWDSYTRSITAQRGADTVQMRIGSRESRINGQRLLLDQPAIIYQGSTLVPLRFVAEALGAQVRWVEYPPSISITYTPGKPQSEPERTEPNVSKQPVSIPQPQQESISAERLISKGTLQPVRRIKINATEYTSVYKRPAGYDASDIDFSLNREWEWFEAEIALADNSNSKFMKIWGAVNDDERAAGHITIERFKDPVTFRVRVADAVIFHFIARGGDDDLILINPRFTRQK